MFNIFMQNIFFDYAHKNISFIFKYYMNILDAACGFKTVQCCVLGRDD